jgi:hypothetical protein
MKDNEKIGASPDDVDLMLRIGTFSLLHAKYKPHFGDEAKFLSAAILNYALLMDAGNETALEYYNRNESLIQQQAKLAHLDRELHEALSRLVDFVMIRTAPESLGTFMALQERADQLSLTLPKTPDFNAENALVFLDDLRAYAHTLMERGMEHTKDTSV